MLSGPEEGDHGVGMGGPFSFADLPGLTFSLTAAVLPQYSSLLPHVVIRELNVAGVNGDILLLLSHFSCVRLCAPP